jgi:hypothetical protein
MIGIEDIVRVVLFILVVGAIAGLLWFLIGYAERNGVPAPFCRVARVIMVVLGVLLLIGILLSLIGHPVVRF